MIIIGSELEARRPHPPLARLAVSLVLLAGCGATAPVGPGATVQVALTEYRVRPQDVSVRAGTLTIVVHNYGRLSHDLVISANGHPEFSSTTIGPGQSTDLFATLTPGTYLMTSTILADQALGIYGTLSVHS